MTIVLFCLAFIIIAAFAWRASRVPLRHRWRRRQARVMCDAFCGRDRSQPPALIYARLRAMDALAFEELLLESFERRGHRVVRNSRYTGDGGIDGQVVIDGRIWLIQAKRYAGAIRPAHVQAFASLCAARGSPGLFIHTGHTGGSSRNAITQHAMVEIVSGRQLLALVSGEAVMIGGRAL